MRAPYTPRPLLGIVFAVLALASVDAGAQTDAQVQEVEESLARDPSYKVRVEAALVLGRLHQMRSVPVLIAALRDSNQAVRASAVRSLGRYITGIGASGPLDAEVVSTHIDAMNTLGVLTSAQYSLRQKLVDGLAKVVHKRLGRAAA